MGGWLCLSVRVTALAAWASFPVVPSPVPAIGVWLNNRSQCTAMARFSGDADCIVLGWWKDVGQPEYWITVTDEANALIWYQVLHKGATFLSIGSNNYLSYRPRGASALGMKIRGWSYAAKWLLVGKNLKCLDNNEFVGVDGNYFYVNGQNVVDVEFIPVQ